MDELTEALADADRALATLEELSGLESPTVIERDAAIKRFEYTFDVAWKTGRKFLLASKGVDERTPKSVIRASRVAGWLDDRQTEAALKMTNDRNLAVHTYKEDLAVEIFERLDGHAKLLAAWLAAMRRGPEEG